MFKRIAWFVLCLVFLFSIAVRAQPAEPIRYDSPLVRVKDVARIQGVRENQIYGLGLVVGLQGSGDGSGARANIQMIANMLAGFGITVSPDDLRLRNIAAVMVTADLPSSVRNGDRIDVTVSSIGDARSLQGGFLLQTPLQAANGEIFAVAQGAVSIGGFVVRGGSSGAQANHTTVGKVPNGAIVERELQQQDFAQDGTISMVLLEPDFTTASRLVSVVNQVYNQELARARDQATIQVEVPSDYQDNVVAFIAELEELPVRPDSQARVVINERTGTVVMGSSVRISAVAVAHGSLSVRVEGGPVLEQPLPGGDLSFQGGTLKLGEEVEPHQLTVLDGANNVQDLVDALNAIGAGPRDIIAILQAIKAAGALYGELVII
ncbi:MAG: flagellar basal body P-ring protein FlgI [Firmicutes bacterium]|nr:flagellar basal body P-ring protein FlgI [Bacillota bacterium]